MGWLSRIVHGSASATVGYPTIDPGADVREGIGRGRDESVRHRDIESDVPQWNWDGQRWARWSALSCAYDRHDVAVPESLTTMAVEDGVAPGESFRLVDGAWTRLPADPASRDGE